MSAVIRQETPDTAAQLGQWSIRDTATGEVWQGDLVTLWLVDLGFDETTLTTIASCLLLTDRDASAPPVPAEILADVHDWIDSL